MAFLYFVVIISLLSYFYYTTALLLIYFFLALFPLYYVVLGLLMCNLLHQGEWALNAKNWLHRYAHHNLPGTAPNAVKRHRIGKGSIDFSRARHTWHFGKRSRVHGEYERKAGALLSLHEERGNRCRSWSLPHGKLPLANMSIDVIHMEFRGAMWQ